jgi:predicted DNA-binding protein YlxM (UPF0122 family)
MSLHAHLGLDEIMLEYNRVAEGVNQHAPDHLNFFNEVKRIYEEIKQLKSTIKAWTRLFLFQNIQTIPDLSMQSIQVSRQRIYNSIQRVAAELTRYCQQQQQQQRKY